MEIINFKKPWPVLIGTLSFALASLPVQAADVDGFTTSTDGACALDPTCALARGGVSDVMTVYAPDGSIVDQIFAFGAEEDLNAYFFDPSVVPVDPGTSGAYTTLLDPDGSISDTFGATGDFLAFISGLNNFPQPIPGLTFTETLGTPVPWILEPDSAGLTIEYDATAYLSPEWRAEGYRAGFRSDVDATVPEPATLCLLVAGAVAAGSLKRKNKSAV